MSFSERDSAKAYFHDYGALFTHVIHGEDVKTEEKKNLVHSLVKEELYREHVLLPQQEHILFEQLQPRFLDEKQSTHMWAKDIVSQQSVSVEDSTSLYQRNLHVLQEEKDLLNKEKRGQEVIIFIPQQDIATLPTGITPEDSLGRVVMNDVVSDLDYAVKNPEKRQFLITLLKRNFTYLDEDLHVPQILSTFGQEHFTHSGTTYQLKDVLVLGSNLFFSGWMLDHVKKLQNDDTYRSMGTVYVGLVGNTSKLNNLSTDCMEEMGVAYVKNSSLQGINDAIDVISFEKWVEGKGIVVTPHKSSYKSKLRRTMSFYRAYQHVSKGFVHDHISQLLVRKVGKGFEHESMRSVNFILADARLLLDYLASEM